MFMASELKENLDKQLTGVKSSFIKRSYLLRHTLGRKDIENQWVVL